jgi:hypothetical protein
MLRTMPSSTAIPLLAVMSVGRVSLDCFVAVAS